MAASHSEPDRPDDQSAEPPDLERQFRALVESAPTAFVMADRAGHIVLVNAETEKLFGYGRDELIGSPLEILVPERYAPDHPELRAAFFATPSARPMGAGRDLFARRKDGSEFPVEIGLNPVETSRGLFVLSAIADITERKRLEQRIRATVESAPTAMLMVDRAGLIVLVNAETEKLFGYPRDELVGRSAEVLVPERDRKHHAELRSGFFAEPSARRMGAGRDLFARRRDGSEFPVEIGLNPVETEDGLYVLSAIADITERKRLEQAQESLSQELLASNQALTRSNEVLQQFAYITSHDLQEPLRMVASFTDLLARRYGDVLDEEGRGYIHFANDGAKRMKQMIEDLLTFARVDESPSGPTEADSAAILSAVLSDLSIAMEECRAQVRHGDLPKVAIAPTHLKQLIQNIVSNAIKFRDNAPPEIDIAAVREDGMAHFVIADNGIGIDPSFADRIFEVFRRLHSHDQYPGSGIGLATCKKIVERYGGRIWVETGAGKGSRFHFTLPIETQWAA